LSAPGRGNRGAGGLGRAGAWRRAWLAAALAAVLALAGCAGGQGPREEAEAQKQEDEYGLGPALWLAARDCDQEELAKLLRAGAEPNFRYGDWATTPLMETVASFDNKCPKKTARMLLQAGAQVNLQDERGWTALHYAAAGHCVPSHVEALHFLIRQGADPTILSKDKRSPLDLATQTDCSEAMGVLADYIQHLQKLKQAAQRAPWAPPAPGDQRRQPLELQPASPDESQLPWMKGASPGSGPAGEVSPAQGEVSPFARPGGRPNP
jgi:hypothetical protein